MPRGSATPTCSRSPARAGRCRIQGFFIRGGQNWGHRAFFPAHTNDVPEAEVLSSFLVQFYEDMPPPKRILRRP